MKYIILFLPFFGIAQDTIQVEMTANGKPYRGTLTAVKPAPIPTKVMRLSAWRGSVQAFVDSALKVGDTAYFDQPVTGGNIAINYNGVVRSDTNIQHICNEAAFFNLKPLQRIHIDGFRVQNQRPSSVAFNADVTPGSTLYDTISNCIVTGTGGAYTNSRGSIDGRMRITAISNSRFQTVAVPVSVFSQDGNNRALHLYNMRLSSDSTHCIYVHPGVSLFYDSVEIIRAGKLGQHQFSGSGNGGYGTAKYSVLTRIYSERNGFELTNIAAGPIRLSNSRLQFYTTLGVDAPNVQAVNCHITGGSVAGTLTACTGNIWTAAPFTTSVRNSQLNEVTLRWGGSLIADSCSMESLWFADRGIDFNATIRNGSIGSINDGRQGNGIIRLSNTTYRRSNARPGVIQ